MSNSRRWREFITWWESMKWQFIKQEDMKHLIAIIDHKIAEIKKPKES
jgi:hypothetical protein